MFYPESDTIASDHPELADQIHSVDRHLYELGEQPFRLEPTADLLDVKPRALERLLRLYEAHGVIERVEIFICPEDSEILDSGNVIVLAYKINQMEINYSWGGASPN